MKHKIGDVVVIDIKKLKFPSDELLIGELGEIIEMSDCGESYPYLVQF